MHFGAQSRGLRAPCERFAPWVAPGPRITRFRLAADLGRMGLDTHRVSNKVSKITSRHLVPLNRAFPGTRVGARTPRLAAVDDHLSAGPVDGRRCTISPCNRGCIRSNKIARRRPDIAYRERRSPPGDRWYDLDAFDQRCPSSERFDRGLRHDDLVRGNTPRSPPMSAIPCRRPDPRGDVLVDRLNEIMPVVASLDMGFSAARAQHAMSRPHGIRPPYGATLDHRSLSAVDELRHGGRDVGCGARAWWFPRPRRQPCLGGDRGQALAIARTGR